MAANVAPSGPDARLGHPPTTYIARYVPPMMARVTHHGNIVPNSQRYLQFSSFKIAEGDSTDVGVDFTVAIDVLTVESIYNIYIHEKIDNTCEIK